MLPTTDSVRFKRCHAFSKWFHLEPFSQHIPQWRFCQTLSPKPSQMFAVSLGPHPLGISTPRRYSPIDPHGPCIGFHWPWAQSYVVEDPSRGIRLDRSSFERLASGPHRGPSPPRTLP